MHYLTKIGAVIALSSCGFGAVLIHSQNVENAAAKGPLSGPSIVWKPGEGPITTARDLKAVAIENALAFAHVKREQCATVYAMFTDPERQNVSYPLVVCLEVRRPGFSVTGTVITAAWYACDSSGRVICLL
jgi:hypothetical protein